jgi:hypothetical protein
MKSLKRIFLVILINLMMAPILNAQSKTTNDKKRQEIYTLIDQYSQAREKKDTLLLKSILTTDVDQLVSSGEWRNGVQTSVKGMLRSSESNPGSRKLIVEKIRFLNKESAIADARYEIHNTDGITRKMWSTFIMVYDKPQWKITAIRNMLPTGQ